MEEFHFEPKYNRVISRVPIGVVFQKAGYFIFLLGFSTCFDFLIQFLLLVIHSYNYENGIRLHKTDISQIQNPIMYAYYYNAMRMAYYFGNFLFMT